MADKATFHASFPAIQTAIKITGDGGGMRIQFDIPESDMNEAVKLLLMRQMIVVVTVEPETNGKQAQQNSGSGSNSDPTVTAPKRAAAKRRN